MDGEDTAARAEEISAEEARRLASLKKDWLAGLEMREKNRVLFELEILLKGMDRFFNVSNLPLTNMEKVITFNFVDELEIVLKFVDRVVELSGLLLEASRREDYQFRQYVETRLLRDYERSRWLQTALSQRSPEDSLFVLYSTFLNLREIVRGMIGLKSVSYTLFFNVGNLITREMISNRFFSPSRMIEFKPEYDKMANRRIGHVIRSIGDPDLTRLASIVVLAFNRLLQYLEFIDPRAETVETLKSSLLFFALIHSESKYLIEYLDNSLPLEIKSSSHRLAGKFAETCDSLSFQLQMELRKIHSGELMNLSKDRKFSSVKTAVENSHGILKNFLQQSIIHLLKTFDEALEGESIYPEFVSRKKQSLKLREDLAVLCSLMEKYEEIIETTEAGMNLETYQQYLELQKGWIGRMRGKSIPLMRHQDLVEYEKYFRYVEDLKLDDLHLMDKLDGFKMESKFFKILVETTLGQINNRTDLREDPLDEDRVEAVLKKFIGERTT